jgi:hypothetical protein
MIIIIIIIITIIITATLELISLAAKRLTNWNWKLEVAW